MTHFVLLWCFYCCNGKRTFYAFIIHSIAFLYPNPPVPSLGQVRNFSCSGKGGSCVSACVLLPRVRNSWRHSIRRFTLQPSAEVLELAVCNVFLTVLQGTLRFSVVGACHDILFTCTFSTDSELASARTCHGIFRRSVAGSSCQTWLSGNSCFKCGMGSCPTHGTMKLRACHARCKSNTYFFYCTFYQIILIWRFGLVVWKSGKSELCAK